MNSKKQRLFFSCVVRNLVLPVFFFSFFIASSTVAGAEAEIRTTSDSNTGEALLITVTLALALSGLMIKGIISWARRQDDISDNINYVERSEDD